MPEAPELEVVKDFLSLRARGAAVLSGRVLRPSVVRPVVADLAADIGSRTIEAFRRRGKFLLVELSGERRLAINPMLTGALQFCRPDARVFKKTCVILSLSNGYDLRYLDDRQMGRVYYTSADRLDEVPQLGDMGPDVLDGVSFEEFRRRLQPFRDEIKGILTRGRVLSGIGNGYADEILFAARIYPFRKRGALTDEELSRLHRSCGAVIEEATRTVRERMGDDIHLKFRDFLKVHNKGGEPCPRCGAAITQITANRRITSYCRSCQPGMLLKT